MSVKKDSVFEEAEKQVMLAKKTLETLQVIETAEVILREKFNENPSAWVTAVFEALSMKNPAYLMEEMKANDVMSSTLNSKFDDSFWDKENYQNVTITGYQLINSFKKFMIGLNRNADFFHLENMIPDLRDTEKSIQSYLNTIRHSSVGFEVSDKSSFEQTIGTKEKDAARKPDMSQLCPECNTKIVIFNNDVEFSYQLHCQETSHKKAVAKPASKIIEPTTKIFEKRSSEPEIFTSREKNDLRKTLNEKLKKHSDFIHIVSKRDFHCNLCGCAISSLQNVESHVEGSKHKNAWKLFISKISASSNDIFTIDHSGIPFVQLKM